MEKSSTSYLKTMGERIEHLLKREGMTQKILADLIKVSRNTMGRIIRNEHEPGVEKIRLIALNLKADLNWLITGQTFEQRRESIHIHHINQKGNKGGASLHIGYKIALPPGRHIKEPQEIYLGEDILQLIQLIQKLTPAQRQKLLRLIQEIFEININT